jgi:hypothetical protein
MSARPSQSALRRGEAAAWGRPEPRRMRLISFKPIEKGSLCGFASIELPIGLLIDDIPVLVSNGKAWASLPAKPQLDQDGRHKRDVNGKLAYTAFLRWRDRDMAARFSAAIVELVREAGHRIPDEAP